MDHIRVSIDYSAENSDYNTILGSDLTLGKLAKSTKGRYSTARSRQFGKILIDIDFDDMSSLDEFMFLYDQKVVCEKTVIMPNSLEIKTSEEIKNQQIESRRRIRQMAQEKTIIDHSEFSYTPTR